MYTTDGQTDGQTDRQKQRLLPLSYGLGITRHVVRAIADLFPPMETQSHTTITLKTILAVILIYYGTRLQKICV